MAHELSESGEQSDLRVAEEDEIHSKRCRVSMATLERNCNQPTIEGDNTMIWTLSSNLMSGGSTGNDRTKVFRASLEL